MRTDMKKAIALMEEGEHTCVVCRGEQILTTRVRGVKPLLNWLDAGVSLAGFCAADKVVGRAAAFLYCLLQVDQVYARVMSRPAAEVLEDHGISVFAEKMTQGIINRSGTGPCPFEAAVMDITGEEEALLAIRRKMADMERR